MKTSKLNQNSQSHSNPPNESALLYTYQFETPLGTMIGLANEEALFFLEFLDLPSLALRTEQIKKHTQGKILEEKSSILIKIEEELNAYFKGELKIFKTPVIQLGTPFQKKVWDALSQIPYGKTRSYGEQAHIVGSSSAFRAVGTANGANRHCIIVPCHRVVNTDGKLGGYGSGLWRKEWLLNHEKQHATE